MIARKIEIGHGDAPVNLDQFMNCKFLKFSTLWKTCEKGIVKILIAVFLKDDRLSLSHESVEIGSTQTVFFHS